MGLPSWFVERRMLAATEVVKRPGTNDRPGIALIGCGNMGLVDTLNASHHGDVLAVCDVDSNWRAAAVGKLAAGDQKPQLYHDLRRMLGRSDFHVIINVTPDEWLRQQKLEEI